MTELQKKEILALIGNGIVRENEMMSSHTTFRVGGPVSLWVEPTMDELPDLVTYLKRENISCAVIGNGSNLLVSDDGFDGVVIHLGEGFSEVHLATEKRDDAENATGNSDGLGGVASSAEDGNTVITAGSGILLSALSKFAADHSLAGLEFASGIPGTLGGGVVMNAGAYGGELKDVITSVTVLEADGIHTYSNEEMKFSYRHSRLSRRENNRANDVETDISSQIDAGGIVLSVTLSLPAGDADTILATMRDFNQRRQEKQPLNYPSAGSTFKRPEGHFAGKLIEDAGLRGYELGGAAVSEKHCGFIINKSSATASDIYALIRYVQQKVYETFGIQLECEVKFLGYFSAER